ncbi:LacI family transcriptional regulator, partial [Streptomyces sp. T21Q-yed]|nr:LacI family transcriptional regulator [Streptomyces sp. T21Q-yed]
MTERTGEATTPPTGGGATTHTLGLLYPPAGRGRVYTTMQLAFIGGVAEAATPYGYDVLLSPAGTDADASFRRMVGERPV